MMVSCNLGVQSAAMFEPLGLTVGHPGLRFEKTNSRSVVLTSKGWKEYLPGHRFSRTGCIRPSLLKARLHADATYCDEGRIRL